MLNAAALVLRPPGIMAYEPVALLPSPPPTVAATASLDGASIAEIASQLVVSEGTVRNHLSIAIQKLGVRNRIEAARLAEAKGWL
jgi:two-component system response regulator DesR